LFETRAVRACARTPVRTLNRGKAGDVLTVELTVLSIRCLGLNGGPAFRHIEAFSFQIAADNQEETDRYWNAIGRVDKRQLRGVTATRSPASGATGAARKASGAFNELEKLTFGME
jgi:predicted 3-demethylubiquinone-9 3-methyltransferase (glyoxalase superfamily)